MIERLGKLFENNSFINFNLDQINIRNNVNLKNKYRMAHFIDDVLSYKDILLVRIFHDRDISIANYVMKRYTKERKEAYKKVKDKFGLSFYIIDFGLIIFLPLLLSVLSNLLMLINKINLISFSNIFAFYVAITSLFKEYFLTYNAFRSIFVSILFILIFYSSLYGFLFLINTYLGV